MGDSQAEPTFTLHFFPKPDSTIPSHSFFCQKLECYLRIAGIPPSRYTIASALPFFQPKGKLPGLTLHVSGGGGGGGARDEYMVDTHFIIRSLTERGILRDVDASLSLTIAQRSESRAWQAWTEDIIYPAIVHTRWARPKNYAAMSRTLPSPRPVVAWIFRRRILPALWTHGIGRHTDAERDILLREWTDALAARFADGRVWFHGAEGPSAIDAIVGSLLVNTASLESNPEFNAMWMTDASTRAYAHRCVERIFPEYKSLLETLSAAEDAPK